MVCAFKSFLLPDSSNATHKTGEPDWQTAIQTDTAFSYILLLYIFHGLTKIACHYYKCKKVSELMLSAKNRNPWMKALAGYAALFHYCLSSRP